MSRHRKNTKLHQRLNLEVAWERSKSDFRERCFLSHPWELSLIEADLNNWLSTLRKSVEKGTYSPEDSLIVDVPKPGWHIRPGSVLTARDSVMYSALVYDCIGGIQDKIGWSAEKVRFSNLLKKDQTKKYWFRYNPTKYWVKFGEGSLALIDEGHEYVLYADISAFYENIDLRQLLSDLTGLGLGSDAKNILQKCFYRWAGGRERGVPQGFAPSDILAEIYLNSVDQALANADIRHLRYSDDIRIFCRTEREAIGCLQILTGLLREKGLNLQTAKTVIKTAGSARKDINGILREVSDINSEILEDARNFSHQHYPSAPPALLEKLYSTLKTGPSEDALVASFIENFTKGTSTFNRSLFHFLINRLGVFKNDAAVGYCLNLPNLYPEETAQILGYFSKLPRDRQSTIAENLAEMINDDMLVYEYQRFLILRWTWQLGLVSEKMLKAARRMLRGRALPHTEYYCVAYLGDYGNSADLNYIRKLYRECQVPLKKATIVCALRKLPKDERNGMYKRVAEDDYLVRLAVDWSKQH